MTILLYVKDEGLYSDTRVIERVDEHRVIAKHFNKINISKDKTFMWAMTGEVIVSQVEDQESVISEFLHSDNTDRIVYLNKRSDEYELLDKIGSNIIIVTKQGVYCKDKKGVSLITADYHAMGAMPDEALAVMRLTGDPVKAMECTMRLCLLSGGEMQFVSINELVEMEKE